MWSIVGIVVLAAAASSSRRDGERPSGEPAPSGIPAAARSGEGSSLVPPSLACPRFAFVENAGQWGGGVRFAAPRSSSPRIPSGSSSPGLASIPTRIVRPEEGRIATGESA